MIPGEQELNLFQAWSRLPSMANIWPNQSWKEPKQANIWLWRSLTTRIQPVRHAFVMSLLIILLWSWSFRIKSVFASNSNPVLLLSPSREAVWINSTAPIFCFRRVYIGSLESAPNQAIRYIRLKRSDSRLWRPRWGVIRFSVAVMLIILLWYSWSSGQINRFKSDSSLSCCFCTVVGKHGWQNLRTDVNSPDVFTRDGQNDA
jgi:hypothetical protein